MPNASKAKTKLALKEVQLAVFIILFSVVLLIRFNFLPNNVVDFGTMRYAVEVADTPEERQQGLSGRDNLSDGDGMLFIFQDPGIYGFWMKEMKFSIDIIWIDIDGKVVHIESNVPPESYPRIYYPNIPATYVLEIPAGAAEQHSINVGDAADIQV